MLGITFNVNVASLKLKTAIFHIIACRKSRSHILFGVLHFCTTSIAAKGLLDLALSEAEAKGKNMIELGRTSHADIIYDDMTRLTGSPNLSALLMMHISEFSIYALQKNGQLDQRPDWLKRCGNSYIASRHEMQEALKNKYCFNRTISQINYMNKKLIEKKLIEKRRFYIDKRSAGLVFTISDVALETSRITDPDFHIILQSEFQRQELDPQAIPENIFLNRGGDPGALGNGLFDVQDDESGVYLSVLDVDLSDQLPF